MPVALRISESSLASGVAELRSPGRGVLLPGSPGALLRARRSVLLRSGSRQGVRFVSDRAKARISNASVPRIPRSSS